MTGDLIDAPEAERIGLVNRVVPADRLAPEVDALAEKLARVPPDVMAPNQVMLNRAMDAAGFAAPSSSARPAIVRQHEHDGARVRRDRAGRRAQGALAWRDRRTRSGCAADRPADLTAPPPPALAGYRTDWMDQGTGPTGPWSCSEPKNVVCSFTRLERVTRSGKQRILYARIGRT